MHRSRASQHRYVHVPCACTYANAHMHMHMHMQSLFACWCSPAISLALPSWSSAFCLVAINLAICATHSQGESQSGSFHGISTGISLPRGKPYGKRGCAGVAGRDTAGGRIRAHDHSHSRMHRITVTTRQVDRVPIHDQSHSQPRSLYGAQHILWRSSVMHRCSAAALDSQ